MKIVITGATGFVGSHLTQAFAKIHDVTALIREKSNTTRLAKVLPSKQIVKIDSDPIQIASHLRDLKPDVVIHLASLFIAEHKIEDVRPLLDSNIVFGTALVEGMCQAGCKRLINTGTSWQNYQNQNYNPVCLYAATKQAFEDILKFYVDAEGLSVINLRLTDTYGPEDLRPKLFSLLKKTADQQNTLDMSAGEQLIDLVFIDDVVRAFEIALERMQKNPRFETFRVSASNTLSLRDLVKTYSQVTKKNLNINWGARPYRRREVMQPATIVPVLPHWSPQVSLEDGIRRLENV